MIQSNEAQLQELLKANQEMMAKNRELEDLSTTQLEALAVQEERQRMLGQQTDNIQNLQWNHRKQMGAHEQATLQMQQDLAQMRERNRNRTPDPSSSSACTMPVIHEKMPAPIFTNQTTDPLPGLKDNANLNYDKTPIDSRPPPGRTADPQPIYFQTTDNGSGYRPMPCVGFPNMVVDNCPGFTPITFQNWKREIKLRIAGQPGATVTQLLAKLIHVLPLAVKTEALIYMENTEQTPEQRSIGAVIEMLDSRYGKTDSERACAWLSAFTDFKRETQEDYEDFWSRFTRCVAKLEALGMAMGEKVALSRAIHAIRLPDGQLPIALSALETRQNPNSVAALREITIRMYETHKTGTDSTEAYVANPQ